MFGSLRLATRPASSHEDAFLERYARLRDRALNLTRDAAQADDLVQGAFVNFVLSRTPLEDIQNLDAYLYTMLQHMHVSQIRRAVRSRQGSLELVDHDSAAFALKGADAAARLQTSEELGLICEYACNRRLSSKTGSALLLRFFHGYFAREIASILRVETAVVDGLLHIARREARAYVADPAAFTPISPGPAVKIARPDSASSDGCLASLRSSIFALAHDGCYPREWFERTFDGAREPAALTCGDLADIVTCPRCLDSVNERLGLSPLSERYPTDFLGQDRRSGPGDRFGGSGGAGAGGGVRAARLRRAVEEVREHRPRELMVAVNGFTVASQRVSSALTEQTVSVNISEPIGFVEVFSEQQVGLLYLPVEPLPDGPIEQSAEVELGASRFAEVTLDLSNTWPRLSVAYRDPSLDVVAAGAGEAVPAADRTAAAPEAPARFRWKRAAAWLVRPWALPATIGALALAVWAVHLLVGTPALDAAALLQRAVTSEQPAAGSVAGVEHRVLQLEQRDETGAGPASTTRVEVWRDLASRDRAIRAYAGDAGESTALEIAPSGRAATVYRSGAAPEIVAAERQAAVLSAVEAQEFWRFELSASNFQQLVAGLPRGSVEDAGTTYVVRYEGKPGGGTGRVVRAALTLSKNGLRPVSQIVVVALPGGVREYRCSERSREHLAASPANERFFRPDPNLVPNSPPGAPPPGREPGPEAARLTTEELAALEVEALYRLNLVQATQGEQVSVTGGPAGVRVEAIVETAARKREVAGALDPLLARRGVTVDVKTVREASAARPRARTPISIQGVEPSQAQISAFPDLLRYFSSHPDVSWPVDDASREARVNREIVSFGTRMLSHSRRALQRAWALETLISLVPPETAARLPAATLAGWWSMVREHSGGVVEETTALHDALAPIFPPAQASRSGARETAEAGSSLTDLVRGLLACARRQDELVRSAFTVPAGGSPSSMELASLQFWDALDRTASLARSVSRVR